MGNHLHAKNICFINLITTSIDGLRFGWISFKEMDIGLQKVSDTNDGILAHSSTLFSAQTIASGIVCDLSCIWHPEYARNFFSDHFGLDK